MPDQEKRKTLLRQWEMLKLLPKTPEPQVTVKHLREGLAAAGFDVDERTIQRDLKALADIFPIDVQDRSPPLGGDGIAMRILTSPRCRLRKQWH